MTCQVHVFTFPQVEPYVPRIRRVLRAFSTGGGRPQIKVRTSFEVRTSIEVCRISIEVRLQPNLA